MRISAPLIALALGGMPAWADSMFRPPPPLQQRYQQEGRFDLELRQRQQESRQGSATPAARLDLQRQHERQRWRQHDSRQRQERPPPTGLDTPAQRALESRRFETERTQQDLDFKVQDQQRTPPETTRRDGETEPDRWVFEPWSFSNH